MSFYDRQDRRTTRRLFTSSSSSRTAFGYWIPLAITLTAATAGLAAWVWNERSKDSEEEDEYVYEHDYESDYDERIAEEQREKWRREHGESGGDGTSAAGAGAATEFFNESTTQQENVAAASTVGNASEADEGFMASMRGALGRTPSPQQLVSGAREKFSAGVAAVGRGLNSIREGDEGGADYFGDQERWSEEAESRERTDDNKRDIGAIGAAAAAGGALVGAGAGVGAVVGSIASTKKPSPSSRGRVRTIAIVVSADTSDRYGEGEEVATYHVEHTSILSHLIGHINPENIQLLILIHAPHMDRHPLSSITQTKSRRTSTGSYDKLSDYPQSDDPSAPLRSQPPIPLEDQDAESKIISSYTSASNPNLYNALATQAATLVTHPTHIMPFTSATGHVHMLKHLAPSLVYIQESLCGEDGKLVREVEGWVGQCVVVVGAEGAGLVDTETEDEGSRRQEEERGGKWWQDERRVGLGKGVEVVEGVRLGEDWGKRVGGQ